MKQAFQVVVAVLTIAMILILLGDILEVYNPHRSNLAPLYGQTMDSYKPRLPEWSPLGPPPASLGPGYNAHPDGYRP